MELRRLSAKLCMGAIILVAAVMLVGSGGSQIPVQMTPIKLRQHRPALIHRVRDKKSSEFYNWSGYAVTGTKGSVTDVKASWVVPQVTCAGTPNGYAAFWTGIDGWSSNTVEQIGTDSDCVNVLGTKTNTPTYYAWFEFYPKGSYLIGNYNKKGVCTSNCVFVGDTISAEVTATGNSPKGGRGGQSFMVTITDETQGWSFSTSSTVSNAQQSSAEWIAETPYGCNTASGFCQLSDFNTAYYGEKNTSVPNTAFATVNGVTQALGQFGGNVQEAIMVNYPSGATIMAEPTAVDGATETSFNVAWYSAGP
jgi:hypothetical protein